MNSNYRKWLIQYRVLAAMLLFAASPGLANEASRNQRYNIVWIVADDLSCDLSCYGEPAVNTPHIDALAKHGIRFTNAFSTSPVCSASRSAFTTGVYQNSINAEHHRTQNPQALPKGLKTVMAHLQQAGYHISNRGKTDLNFKSDFKFDGNDWSNRDPDQPFFSQFQVSDTHRPFKKRNKDPQRVDQIRLPPRYPDHPLTRTDWANYLASIESFDNKVADIIKQLKKDGAYENTAIFIFGDHGRAHVWDKQWLYEGGIKVPLVVRLPANLAGAQDIGTVQEGLVSLLDLFGTTLSLAGLEVPSSVDSNNLVAREYIGRKQIYAARDRSGDAIDRIRAIRTSQFKYIKNYRPELAYSTRSSYKNLQYPVLVLSRILNKQSKLNMLQQSMFADTKPGEELYDIVNDPYETKNLAGEIEHDETLKTFRIMIEQWCKNNDPNGSRPEMSPDDFKKLAKSKHQWFSSIMQKRGLDENVPDEEYLQWWMDQLDVDK